MHVKMRFSNMNSKIIQDQITYQKIVINENLRYFKPSSVKKQKTFLNEITLSLNRTPKSINPKFFYDNTGSKLFDMICSLPEYYLYNSEIEILRNIKKEIKSYIDSEIRLVELGSGSSIKTRILLDTLYDLQTDVEYFPIDISDILSFSTQELCNIYKDLKITGIIDTYENGLNFIEGYDNKPNLIPFLGSSLGNFNHLEGIQFLKTISTMMKDSDLFLIGFDLKKNESILQKAYNDSNGITAKFNLNVLKRINTELNGDFDLSKFSHHVVYNEMYGRIEMYLKSLCTQTVKITDASMSINLLKYELIHTENSYKFSISQIESKFEEANIKIKKIWYDSQNYFALVLGQKI